MRRRIGLRIAIVAAVIVGSFIYLYPPPFLRPWLYAHPPVGQGRGLLPGTINLGLDLQGGIHLVLGVDLDKAIESQVERAVPTVRATFEKKGVAVTRIQRRGVSELVVELASPQAFSGAQTAAAELRELRAAGAGPGRRPVRPRPAPEGSGDASRICPCARRWRPSGTGSTSSAWRSRPSSSRATTASSCSCRACRIPSAPRPSSARRRCSSSSSWTSGWTRTGPRARVCPRASSSSTSGESTRRRARSAGCRSWCSARRC